MLNYQQLAVACCFYSASISDIEAYIASVVESGEEYDNRIFEAYSNDVRIAWEKILDFIAYTYPDYDVYSEQGVEPCKAELKRQIHLLLDKKITPHSFCLFFNAMEMPFAIDLGFEMPFFGNLYNCCDWSDDSWTLENSPHLVEECIHVLSIIDKDQRKPEA